MNHLRVTVASGSLIALSTSLASTSWAQVEPAGERPGPPPPAIEPDPASRPEPASDLSPQNFAIELRFGPYSPRVDEGTESPVFEDFFGDKNRYMFGVEIDWQIFRVPYVGTFGVGAGWGYTSFSAPNHPTGQEGPETVPVAQESTLAIMPMHAVGVFRVDVLARHVGIPLVPYGKLGLGYALWWVNDGIGTARSGNEDDQGTIGKDTSTGIQGAAGLMLQLDPFDPVAARAMDAEAGINNSYLFFEWSRSDFSGAQMNVGSSSWVAGLAIEL